MGAGGGGIGQGHSENRKSRGSGPLRCSFRIGSIGSLASTGDEFLGVADLVPATNRVEANFTVPRFQVRFRVPGSMPALGLQRLSASSTRSEARTESWDRPTQNEPWNQERGTWNRREYHEQTSRPVRT